MNDTRHMAAALGFSGLQTGAATQGIVGESKAFRLQCSCKQPLFTQDHGQVPMDLPAGRCAVSELRIRLEDYGEGMDLEAVKQHIGMVYDLQWAQVGAAAGGGRSNGRARVCAEMARWWMVCAAQWLELEEMRGDVEIALRLRAPASAAGVRR